MAEYQLYCFAQSGNAYRCALMLNLIGADWEPIWVDFFAKGEQRTPEYRANINEMGEAPVLVHGAKKLSQSGVILTYLADRSGKFRPDGEDERLEALRWILFDNQKVNGYLGPYRFLRFLSKPPGDPAVLAFLKGRIDGNLAIVDKRLSTRPFMLGARPTIADLSLVGYSVLSGRGVRLRHPGAAQAHRGLARSHQGAAGLEAPLRPHAGTSAAGKVRRAA
jgi:glutathione S-transferase